jgi:hypothetical protein
LTRSILNYDLDSRQATGTMGSFEGWVKIPNLANSKNKRDSLSWKKVFLCLRDHQLWIGDRDKSQSIFLTLRYRKVYYNPMKS